VQRDGSAVGAKQTGHKPREQIGRGAHAQCGDAAAVERGEVGLGGTHTRDHRIRVGEQNLAGLGECERASAARALDQPLTGQVFERRNLVADCGLDVAETRRGAAERPFSGDGIERREVPKLDSGPPFRRH
jgi:hypothetical protein